MNWAAREHQLQKTITTLTAERDALKAELVALRAERERARVLRAQEDEDAMLEALSQDEYD